MKKSVLVIITTYLSIIVIGALLLMLPVSSHTGSIEPENALFTSASAITVTGLIVVDTSTYFT
jgi:trk system potassium uptake protein TrkH